MPFCGDPSSAERGRPNSNGAQESMSSIPISKEGFKKLEKELEELKRERPAVIEAIKAAREEGDLRENAGYDAARERQGMLEARIKYIESRMASFNVIDLATMGGDKACFGATVEVEDMDTGDAKRFTLLGPDEADFGKGSVSVFSPVGKALLGKEEGDEVVVKAPKGTIRYEIISITFKG
jgi:transcription elongation factor GreA